MHESDVAPGGVEGTGLTSIEHIEPQAHAPHLSGVYENCAYACRYCNNARRALPIVHPSGARLLHPWRDAWGHHFRWHEDRLEPLSEGEAGRDARYTASTYQINDPRRISLRRERRRLLMDRIRLFEHDIGALYDQAMRQPNPEDRQQLLRLAQDLTTLRSSALAELRQRAAIPADAPSRCRCDSREHHCLPPGTEVLQVPLG